MHARRTPLVLALTDAVRRLVMMSGVFFFALALTTLAMHGSGPRTVDMTYPDASQQQQRTEQTAQVAPTR